jgi:hypothetical protein
MIDDGDPLRYHDADGRRHKVFVRRTADGDWQVLDTCREHTSVVETLDGREDGPQQAQAVARDYLQTAGGAADAAGRPPGRPIPDRRGADERSDRRHHQRARQPQAGAAALPRAAR